MLASIRIVFAEKKHQNYSQTCMQIQEKLKKMTSTGPTHAPKTRKAKTQSKLALAEKGGSLIIAFTRKYCHFFCNGIIEMS